MSATTAIEVGELQPWNPPVEFVRKALLEENIVSLSLPDAGPAPALPIGAVNGLARYAAQDGLLFDLGNMPNAIIKSEFQRARALYRNGHIDHPYRVPYVIFHTWEGGVGAYLVLPTPDTSHGFVTVELLPVRIRGVKLLLVGDTASVEWPPGAAADGCIATVFPSPMRAMAAEEGIDKRDPELVALSNSMEPVLAAMLLLVTDGLEVERVPASKLLNRSRPPKDRKQPLPPHFCIHTAPYVTALQNRGRRSATAAGGTHASPVPHLRRGHIRHLPDGKTTWVRDCLVMVADPAERFSRAYYGAGGQVVAQPDEIRAGRFPALSEGRRP